MNTPDKIKTCIRSVWQNIHKANAKINTEVVGDYTRFLQHNARIGGRGLLRGKLSR